MVPRACGLLAVCWRSAVRAIARWSLYAIAGRAGGWPFAGESAARARCSLRSEYRAREWLARRRLAMAAGGPRAITCRDVAARVHEVIDCTRKLFVSRLIAARAGLCRGVSRSKFNNIQTYILNI